MRLRTCLMVVVVMVAGCDGGDKPTAATSSAPPPLVQAWTRTDLKPIGQLTAVAGVAVGYVADGGRLQLLALDPATGRTLWQRAASPGEVVTGIPVTVAVVDDKVVYYRSDPKGNLFASMVVADPRLAVQDSIAFGPIAHGMSAQTKGEDNGKAEKEDVEEHFVKPSSEPLSRLNSHYQITRGAALCPW